MSRFTRWSKHFGVGDRVITQYRFERERRTGTVTRRNGSYVYVKLDYNNQEIEAYDAELDYIEVMP